MMHRLRVFSLAPLLGIVLWSASVGMSASASQTKVPTSGLIDSRVCASMMSTLKAWAKTSGSDKYLTSSRKAGIAKSSVQGCTWRITTGAGKVPDSELPVSNTSGPLVTAHASAPFCMGYYREFGIYDPNGWPIMVGVTNTGWCSDGWSVMNVWWGPDCWTRTYPIYVTQVTWCGAGRWGGPLSNNGNCFPTDGMNWNWQYWGSPWNRGGSYMRTQDVCYSPGGSYTWGWTYDY